ncbi:MAG: dockerin type I domain-containing protein [Clostridiales bacterium]|jgi:predicted acyl esterase|nr:dockerin type I domain-containing protein [Clostridiales bacterium]
MNKRFAIILAITLTAVLAFSAIASAEFVKGFDKNVELSPNWIGVDAQGLPSTMPVFSMSSASNYINEIVWVEVPCDTDRDGKRDRISLWIRRPVTPDGFLCPVVMEFSPYHNSTIGYSRMSAQINNADLHVKGMARTFLYKPNNNVYMNPNNPDTTHLTYDDIRYKGTEAWDPIWWSTDAAFTVNSWYTGTLSTGTETYTDEYGDIRIRNLYTGSVPAATVPGTDPGTPTTFTGSAPWSGNGYPARWNHYLVRGYAGIFGQLLGNRAVEGITNSLHVEEWLSAAAACAWLNGDAPGFTTRNGNIPMTATWANGHVALDGTSYPGTTPTVAAMSGIPGVKAIMPEAHVASWYEYYRSGGTLHGPEGYGGEDMNLHSSFNFTRINSDSTSGIPSATGALFPKVTAQEAYVETQFYMMEKQDRDTGDYNEHWDVRNLTRAYGKIANDVGILQTNGQQDWNVMPRHAYQALQAWRDKWDGTNEGTYGTHKIVSTLTTHASQNSRLVEGKDGVQRGMLKWYLMFLDHYLLGLDNQVDELMYDVNIVNQKTGVMEGFDYDTSIEERGTIIPGTHYQQIYLTEGPEGKAGRLSYTKPQVSVNSFTDYNVTNQISQLPRPAGRTSAKPSATISQNSGQGNYTPTSTQYNYCDDRVVGADRTATTFALADGGGTFPDLISAIDRPIEGRLMYISEPLTEDIRLSGTPVVHLNGAPTKATGNLTVALLEIGRIPRVSCRLGSSASSSGATSLTVFPAENGAGAITASTYGRTGTPARVGTNTCNFKDVTWGHTDIQNPSHDGKAWFDVPEQNYTPNDYFQTTAITPGQYYNYVVEMNPYNYVFEAGMRIAVMVYGTDAMASPNLDAATTGGLEIQLGAGTYIDIPLQVVEAEKPVTIEVADVLASPGGTVDVTYSIKGNAFGFTSLDLKIPYNSAVYTPVGVTAASLLSTPYFVFNPTFAADTMRVAFASDENILGNEVLFTVKYQVAAGAPGTGDFPLNVEPVKMQYEGFMDKLVDLDVAVKPGTLVIGLLGDVNADGFVTPEDAMLILQMIVGLIDWTPRALLLGDINGDGKVDTTDAALILRMVVGG